MTAEALMDLLKKLGLRKLRQSGSNILALCPNHSERRPSWGIHVDVPHQHGCFSCGFRGTLETLLLTHFKWSAADVRKLDLGINLFDAGWSIDDFSQKLKALNESELYPFSWTPALGEYFKLRGISERVARWADVRHHVKDRRALFPWRVGRTLVAITGRALEDNPIKIISYGGSKRDWVYMPFGKLAPSAPVILCEGEIDALAIADAGFSNVAALGKGVISKNQVLLLKELGLRECILFMDDDKRGRALQEESRQMLASRMLVHDVQWSLLVPSEAKRDPASISRYLRRYLLKYGVKICSSWHI